MKTTAQRIRERRAIVLGALVVGPVVAYQVLIGPFLGGLVEARGQVELERGLLAREVAMVADAPAYPGDVQDAATALQAWTARLFSGPDPLSAAAALANYVATEASRSRVLIQESETREANADASGVVTLRVALRGQSDLEGLLELLTALERAERLVHVEELTIRQARPLRDGPVPDDELLSFTALVAGYGLGGGSDDADGFGILTVGGAP